MAEIGAARAAADSAAAVNGPKLIQILRKRSSTGARFPFCTTGAGIGGDSDWEAIEPKQGVAVMPDDSDAQHKERSENIKVPPIPKETAGAVAGAALGSVIGPAGAVVGGIVGAIAGKAAGEGRLAPPAKKAVARITKPAQRGAGHRSRARSTKRRSARKAPRSRKRSAVKRSKSKLSRRRTPSRPTTRRRRR
jgi:hypothetical protein